MVFSFSLFYGNIIKQRKSKNVAPEGLVDRGSGHPQEGHSIPRWMQASAWQATFFMKHLFSLLPQGIRSLFLKKGTFRKIP